MISKRFIIMAGSIACFIACIGDFWVTFTLGEYKPGYSHLIHTMSMLGVSSSPVSDIISAWWILLGFLIILFALGFAQAFKYKTWEVKVSTWLLILYGLGEGFGSGLFKADRLKDSLTLAGYVHEVMGAIGTISILLLPLLMMRIIPRSVNPALPSFSWVVFIVGLVMLIMFMFRFSSYQIEGLLSIKAFGRDCLYWTTIFT